MRALQVDAFAGGIRRDQDTYIGIMAERLLRLHSLFAAHGPMDNDNRLFPANQGANPLLQIGEGVAMFREDHQFLGWRWFRSSVCFIDFLRFRYTISEDGRRKDFRE